MDTRKRMIRHINPLGPRVLVRILHQEDVSEGGLLLPSGAKEKLQDSLYGEVVEVARAAPEDVETSLGTNVAGVPDGANVLFAKEAGIAVPWDPDLRLLDSKEILATVDEIDSEKML